MRRTTQAYPIVFLEGLVFRDHAPAAAIDDVFADTGLRSGGSERSVGLGGTHVRCQAAGVVQDGEKRRY
ncbi:hypothetical protein IscW_ISCW013516 [Ixodes scapularis]|uniref:Uncharacterized protein n=1 Tax=Ixodes scapularis TaxID=6945 RepID=B7QI14_IXOSC|nr:hypothetical protein IscW_ISCW013516 [Ixodes scapularis]|eukprot:XP_002414821.1 hypothetical protein IscW_ISCW013516 [Ixodes scapularis]